jgi:hypothetical protein
VPLSKIPRVPAKKGKKAVVPATPTKTSKRLARQKEGQKTAPPPIKRAIDTLGLDAIMEIANTKNFTKKIRDLVLDEKWVDRGKTRYGDCTDMAVQLMEKTEGQFVPVLGGGHASNVTPTDCKAGFLFARLPSKTRHPLKAHKRLRNAFARQELNSLGKATRLSIPKVVVKRPLHLVAKALSPSLLSSSCSSSSSCSLRSSETQSAE